jgi:hypothetical protein
MSTIPEPSGMKAVPAPPAVASAPPSVVAAPPAVVVQSAAVDPATASSPYEPCDPCGAPLDERQRYCVACGARRAHGHDPAARFLAAATRRRSAVAGAPRARAGGRSSASLAAVALIAAIPAALGGGVLIGRSSAGGDSRLIAALRAQKAPVIQYSGATGSAAAPTAAVSSTPTAARPTSTFASSHGWTVQLGALPAATGAAAAAAAESADRAKGAHAVGLILAADFRITPRPASGAVVIYSGSYATRAAAQAARSKLARSFPAAAVIEVQRAGGSAASGAGRVLSRTRYGAAHQITSYKPSTTNLSQGAQVANQDSHSTGKAASGAGLPDVVAVP